MSHRRVLFETHLPLTFIPLGTEDCCFQDPAPISEGTAGSYVFPRTTSCSLGGCLQQDQCPTSQSKPKWCVPLDLHVQSLPLKVWNQSEELRPLNTLHSDVCSLLQVRCSRTTWKYDQAWRHGAPRHFTAALLTHPLPRSCMRASLWVCLVE